MTTHFKFLSAVMVGIFAAMLLGNPGYAESQPAPNATPLTTHAPIQAGGVAVLDLPDSSAESVSLTIQKGRFSDYAVGQLSLNGHGIDFRNGTLQQLQADVKAAELDSLLVDRLQMTAPAFSFNTMELLNNHTFVLAQPVNAQVSLQLSEAGLNRFVSDPKTIAKIEKSIQRQTGGVKLITLSNPSLNLLGGNQVRLNVTGTVAQGLAVPLEMVGALQLDQGQLSLKHLKLTSGGNDLQLPVDIADSFEKKINEMIDLKRLGKNTFVMTADKLKVTGKTVQVEGHALLTRLQFG